MWNSMRMVVFLSTGHLWKHMDGMREWWLYVGTVDAFTRCAIGCDLGLLDIWGFALDWPGCCWDWIMFGGVVLVRYGNAIVSLGWNRIYGGWFGRSVAIVGDGVCSIWSAVAVAWRVSSVVEL